MAEDIDKAEQPVSPELAQGDFEVGAEHKKGEKGYL